MLSQSGASEGRRDPLARQGLHRFEQVGVGHVGGTDLAFHHRPARVTGNVEHAKHPYVL